MRTSRPTGNRHSPFLVFIRLLSLFFGGHGKSSKLRGAMRRLTPPSAAWWESRKLFLRPATGRTIWMDALGLDRRKE